MSAKYTNDPNNIIFLKDSNIVNTALVNETNITNPIPSLSVTENLSTEVQTLVNKIYNNNNTISNTWNFSKLNVIGNDSCLNTTNIQTENLSSINLETNAIKITDNNNIIADINSNNVIINSELSINNNTYLNTLIVDKSIKSLDNQLLVDSDLSISKKTYLNDVEIAEGKSIYSTTIPKNENDLINKKYADVISNDLQSSIDVLMEDLELLSSNTSSNISTITNIENQLSSKYVYIKTNNNELTQTKDIIGIFVADQQISTSLLTNNSGFITSADVEKQVNSKLVSIYKIQPPYNGTLTELSNAIRDAELSGYTPEIGYVWNVNEDDTVEPPIPGINVVYLSSANGWYLDKLGGTIDLKGYALSSDVSTAINESISATINDISASNQYFLSVLQILPLKADKSEVNYEIHKADHTTSELTNVLSNYTGIGSNNPIQGQWYFENGLVVNNELNVINGKNSPENRLFNINSDNINIFVNQNNFKNLNVNGATTLKTAVINETLSVSNNTYLNDISGNNLSINQINVNTLSIDQTDLSNYINSIIYYNLLSNRVDINYLSANTARINTLSVKDLDNVIIDNETLRNIFNNYLSHDEYAEISNTVISTVFNTLNTSDISCNQLSANIIYVNNADDVKIGTSNLSTLISNNIDSYVNSSITEITEEILSNFSESELSCQTIYTDELSIKTLNNIYVNGNLLEDSLSNIFITRNEYSNISNDILTNIISADLSIGIDEVSCDQLSINYIHINTLENFEVGNSNLSAIISSAINNNINTQQTFLASNNILNYDNNVLLSNTNQYDIIKTAAQNAIVQLSTLSVNNIENISNILIEFLKSF